MFHTLCAPLQVLPPPPATAAGAERVKTRHHTCDILNDRLSYGEECFQGVDQCPSMPAGHMGNHVRIPTAELRLIALIGVYTGKLQVTCRVSQLTERFSESVTNAHPLSSPVIFDLTDPKSQPQQGSCSSGSSCVPNFTMSPVIPRRDVAA